MDAESLLMKRSAKFSMLDNGLCSGASSAHMRFASAIAAATIATRTTGGLAAR